MKLTVTYEPHTCLDGLELLALTAAPVIDTDAYLAEVERVHRECRRCTPEYLLSKPEGATA